MTDAHLEKLIFDHFDDLVAVVVRDTAGAEAMLAACGGARPATPAYAGPGVEVLMFVESDDDEVLERLPGGLGAPLRAWDALPEVRAWIVDPDTPLAPVPAVFLKVPRSDTAALADMGEDVAAVIAEPERRGSQGGAPVEVEEPTPAVPAEPVDPAADVAERRDGGQAVERHRHAGQVASPAAAPDDAPPATVPVDLPDQPTEGPEIVWEIAGGRLVITKAPIDPAAVPTAQQVEAVTALLRAMNGSASASLDAWRAECRSAWQGSMAPGSIPKAFARARAILEERGAVIVAGDRVELRRDPAAPVGIFAKVRRALRSTSWT